MAGNSGFPLKMPGKTRGQTKTRAAETLEKLIFPNLPIDTPMNYQAEKSNG